MKEQPEEISLSEFADMITKDLATRLSIPEYMLKGEPMAFQTARRESRREYAHMLAYAKFFRDLHKKCFEEFLKNKLE